VSGSAAQSQSTAQPLSMNLVHKLVPTAAYECPLGRHRRRKTPAQAHSGLLGRDMAKDLKGFGMQVAGGSNPSPSAGTATPAGQRRFLRVQTSHSLLPTHLSCPYFLFELVFPRPVRGKIRQPGSASSQNRVSSGEDPMLAFTAER
jgi:hypothetical protein